MAASKFFKFTQKPYPHKTALSEKLSTLRKKSRLHAHGFSLHYYDNKQRGEVDFLIDDYDNLSVLPIEVKSGKDYKVHSALDTFLDTPDYHIKSAIVLSNEQNVHKERGITYLPIYYVMFLKQDNTPEEDLVIPEPTLPR